jgi:hypothetical protein
MNPIVASGYPTIHPLTQKMLCKLVEACLQNILYEEIENGKQK